MMINSVNSSTDNNNNNNNLDEAMKRLKIHREDKENGVAANTHLSPSYPDRPGKLDCIYYLRTGLCGYGNNCRFHHPSYSSQVSQFTGELPERIGQPDCQYFLKTGTCRFGATCKYNHPRERLEAGQIPLNMLGLPIRQAEKSCPHYMRTGACKYGFACKFNHPEPTALGPISPAIGNAAYGLTGSSVPPILGIPNVGRLPGWALPRLPQLSDPQMQGPQGYMPVVLSSSHGIIPAQQAWNTYTGTSSAMSSTNVLGSNFIYTPSLTESSASGQVHMLQQSSPQYPERHDQPECQFYMKTGTCKFGSTCKYHHPKERIASFATNTLGPFGLPLRPDQAICNHYSLYGICKFGSACKFDHPLSGFYSYSLGMPTVCIPYPPSSSYQNNSSMACSSENSPSKSSKSPDQNEKPETTSTNYQNLDNKASEEDPSNEADTEVQVQILTSLEEPQDQSE